MALYNNFSLTFLSQGSLACVKELIKRDDLQMNHNKGSVSAVMLAAQNGKTQTLLVDLGVITV